MNTEIDLKGELPEALRWRLRGLRRDDPPARELWTGVAARLSPRTKRRSAWLMPMAVAASLLLVIAAVGQWQTGPTPRPVPPRTLVQREADGLTAQYRGAMLELAPAPPPAMLQPAFSVLDRDAALIRSALAHDPDSRLLLNQLRRTYARRLALAQRVAYG